MDISPLARRRWFYPVLFVFSLAVFSAFFVKGFTGIHGDGVFYYATAVSILWDHDLDLKNQLDTPDPREPGRTFSRGLYSVDKKTGKAFTMFNMGTGVLMVPALAVGKLVDGLRGGRHPDPFDIYYQRLAGFSAVVFSALTVLLLFALLNRFFSFGPALVLPFLFAAGSNWLFYASVFAAVSHVYALFLYAATAWAFLAFLEKRTVAAAALFGLAGGLSFLTRNFAALPFACLFLYGAFDLWKNRETVRPRRATALLAAAAILFLAGAAPQLAQNKAVHGSVFRTSWQAGTEAPEAFGVFARPGFRVLEPANLQFLYSNLFNSDDGLFYCHPLYLVGLLGLLLLRHRDGRFRALNDILLANVFVFWFVDAAYYDTWFNRAAGAGFGHRRFLDMLPVFIFGAAGILEWGRRGRRKAARAVIFAVFAALAATGTIFFREYIAHYGAVYAVQDSFAGLYRFLFAKPPAIGIFVAVLGLLAVLIRTESGGTGGGAGGLWRSRFSRSWASCRRSFSGPTRPTTGSGSWTWADISRRPRGRRWSAFRAAIGDSRKTGPGRCYPVRRESSCRFLWAKATTSCSS